MSKCESCRYFSAEKTVPGFGFCRMDRKYIEATAEQCEAIAATNAIVAKVAAKDESGGRKVRKARAIAGKVVG